MIRRPNIKRIKAPPVLNGSEYRNFKRRELAKLKAYLDGRYEGALLAILKPLLIRVDKSGYVMEGWAVKNIHNYVKIVLYEGQDKYDQFINQLEAIKEHLMEITYGPGMKLHGEVYTFKLVLGGDMAMEVSSGTPAQRLSFFCFICDMPSQYMHLTP
eukprot:jgi/Tetstr1/458387/TSEL_044825.t1